MIVSSNDTKNDQTDQQNNLLRHLNIDTIWQVEITSNGRELDTYC